MSVKWLEGMPLNRAYGSNLVASYKHKGNKIIKPIALDKTTGIFTASESIGLPLGLYTSALDLIIVHYEFTNGIIPREIDKGEKFYINVKSDTTFTLHKGFANSEITSYPHASNTSVDVTKFHFEVNVPSSVLIDISMYDLEHIRVVCSIPSRNRDGWGYTRLIGTHSGGSGVNVVDFGGLDGTVLTSSITEHSFKLLKKAEGDMLFSKSERLQQVYWDSTTGTWKHAIQEAINDNFYRISRYNNLKFTGVEISYKIANGSTIEIFDVKGGLK